MTHETTELIYRLLIAVAYVPLIVCAIWAIILGIKEGDE